MPNIITLRLLVINTATNTVVAGPLLGETQGPRREHMAMAPDGQRVYVINNLDHTISVVSTRTNTVEETWPDDPLGLPTGVAVSPDNRRLYLSRISVINNVLQGALVVIDIASRTRIASIPLGVGSAYGVVASPDGSRVYLVAAGPDAAVVVSTATSSVITTVPLRQATQSTTVTLSPDGRFAYFPRQATTSNTPGVVQVLDTLTNTIVATTTVGIGPWQVAASPNGATVYASSTTGFQSGQVHRLNPSTHAAEGATAAPSALGVAFLPNSARAYIAAGVNIFVMDTATHAVTATIPVPVSHGGNNIAPGAAAIVATPPPFNPPGSTPSNLQATAISGNRVTLTWTAPTSVTPAGYVVEGGVAPGEVLGSLPTGSTATTYTFEAPTGAFYVRVHALTAAGRSAASNEIRIFVNLPQVPSAPTGLLGLANGSNLALSWQSTSSGGPATSHVLDVSGALTLAVPLPPGETFSYAGVPPGTYTFSVRSVNARGTSPPSSPVTLTFPNACPGPPQEPVNFAISRAGSQVTVSWDPPGAGPAVSSYILRVTGALNLTLPIAPRVISGVVPPGTYTLSVLAVNPCGPGIATAAQSITVP